MNLSNQNGDFELRKRFGSSLESRANETKVSSAAYVWESIKSMKRKFSFQAYEYEKKKTIRQNARYAVAYLATFLVLVTVLAVFMIWRNSSADLSSGVSDYEYVTDHTQDLPHHFFGPPHQHLPDALKPKDNGVKWHKQMAELRPDDAINPSFNHMAISIILTTLPDEDALLQTSITTFLRQINYLQIASAHSAHAFVGGAHNSFLSFTPQSNFFPALERYVDGFKTMLTFAPNQDWFIQLDEDSFLFLENIKVYLGRYDPASALFFHNFDLINPDPKHLQQRNLPKLEAHFPVSIMSRAALQLLVKSNYAQCFMQNKYLHSEETILDICLKELGINTILEPLFHPTEPSHDFAWPVDSCKRPLSISQLSTQQLELLYKSRPHTGILKDGTSYKWDSIVTYSDVFQQTFPKSISTVGIDRHSASKSKSEPAASGYDCQKSCVADSECISWTYERPDCYTSPTIGISISRPDVVSGIVNNRYQCLAPVI